MPQQDIKPGKGDEQAHLIAGWDADDSFLLIHARQGRKWVQVRLDRSDIRELSRFLFSHFGAWDKQGAE
jgi:hypothetical protein